MTVRPGPRRAAPDPVLSYLQRDFFDRPSLEVAPALLGCVLEHEAPDGLVAVEITEVEAYAGEVDPASHAYHGKSARNEVMYGPPGHVYVYFTYGMHYCMNVVCMAEGTASAVLLRAGRVVAGEDLARRRRTARSAAAREGTARVLPARDLARGPARLCQALGINREQNGGDLCVPGSPLRLGRVAGNAWLSEAGAISAGPRVGVTAATDRNWRYWRTGDKTVSAYRLHKARPRRPAPASGSSASAAETLFQCASGSPET